VLKTIAPLTRYVVISVPGGPESKADHRYGHFRNYAQDQLRRKMEDCNFEVVRFFRWGWPFYDWITRLSGMIGSNSIAPGYYGRLMKMVAGTFYWLYYMNIAHWGTQVFAVGKSKSYAKQIY